VGAVVDVPGHGAAEDDPEAPDWPGAGHWLAGAGGGAGRGATVTVNEALPVLPALSVAVHLTVVEPTANVLPLAGVHVGVIAPSTASRAVTVYATVAPAADVAVNDMAEGAVRTGAVVSGAVTVTVNEARPVLPALSVAVHLTVVVPTANALPLAGSHVGAIAPSTASRAVAV